MNKYFDIKDKVYDITEKYPETIDVFVANGFKPLANEVMRKTMGKTISLEMALKSKNINVEQFVQRLIEVIEQNRVSEDESLVKKEKVENAEIKIGGVPVTHQDQITQIGYFVEHEALLDHLTVKESIEFVANFFWKSPKLRKLKIREVMEKLWLENIWKMQIKMLSGGEKKRLSIAMICVKEPGMNDSFNSS